MTLTPSYHSLLDITTTTTAGSGPTHLNWHWYFIGNISHVLADSALFGFRREDINISAGQELVRIMNRDHYIYNRKQRKAVNFVCLFISRLSTT